MPALDNFLKVVVRSGLLDSEQVEEVVRTAPADRRGNPEALADHFVKLGKLSRFQASKLLQGTFFGLVLGPYQVLSPLGRGGMGTVYLARDSRNFELVALKILPPKKAREEDRMLARFRREMEVSQRVSHPNLARSFEAGVHQDVYFIAMEYIPGKSLYRLINDHGPLAVPRAARLFSEVALGLAHAHGRGLIHRDLKPSNIIITPNDHAKVLDLGLALIQGESSQDRTVVGGKGYLVGTMDYLAPEQAENAATVDGRSDIYSLGCSLYYALTGQPPFPGGKHRQKIKRHRTEEPTPVAELNPDVPPAFAVILRKLMGKHPDHRPGTAEAVHQELRTWSQGEPVLPLDQVGDVNYRQAVIELESEAWPETALLPPPLPRDPAKSSQFAVFNAIEQLPREASHWERLILAVGIGGLVVIGLAIGVMCYFLAR